MAELSTGSVSWMSPNTADRSRLPSPSWSSPLRRPPRSSASLQTVYDYAARGVLNRHVRGAYDHAQIEARSLAQLKRYHHEPHPYWATSEEAAAVVGVSRSTVPLMMLSNRLPLRDRPQRTTVRAATPARGHCQCARKQADRKARRGDS